MPPRVQALKPASADQTVQLEIKPEASVFLWQTPEGIGVGRVRLITKGGRRDGLSLARL